MLATLVRWIFIIGSGLILLIGLTPKIQRKLDERGLIPNQYRYGDLYNKTNLAQFKDNNFRELDDLDSTDLPAGKVKGVHLYTLGDSFTVIDTSFFAGEKNKHVWITYGTDSANIDTTKRNVLVIEIVERLLQQRMKDSTWRIYIDNVFTDLAPKKVVSRENAAPKTNWLSVRFGPEINNRLEFIFFNNAAFLRLKELKASLMLNLFGRTSGAVLSRDKQAIFYDMEVDSTSELSSFRYLSDAVIDTTVSKLNSIANFYRRQGFDAVYIGLVPNKSAIIPPGPGQYNHQIERIQRHAGLNFSVINLFDTLRTHPDWYHHGDGHWNKFGKRYWLKQVNTIARQ